MLSGRAPSAFYRLITLFYQHHRGITRFNYNTKRVMFFLGVYIVTCGLSLRWWICCVWIDLSVSLYSLNFFGRPGLPSILVWSQAKMKMAMSTQGLSSAGISPPLTFNKPDVKSWYLTNLLLMIFMEVFSTKGEVGFFWLSVNWLLLVSWLIET